LSGNSYDGTAQQNTEDVSATGQIGNCLSFNSSSDYVDTGDTFQSTFRDSFSIAFWFKADDGIPALSKWMLGTLSDDDESEIKFYLDNNGDVGFQIKVNSVGVNEVCVECDYEKRLSDGQTDWHFIVGVADETIIGEGGLKLYYNGDLQTYNGGDTSSWTGGFGSYANTNNLYFGAYNNAGSAYKFWDGELDNVMIFSKALTATEIENLYTSGPNTVIISTTSAHGLSAGDTIAISGVTNPIFNKVTTIKTVPSANTFTYNLSGYTSSDGYTVSGRGSVLTFGGTEISAQVATKTLYLDNEWSNKVFRSLSVLAESSGADFDVSFSFNESEYQKTKRMILGTTGIASDTSILIWDVGTWDDFNWGERNVLSRTSHSKIGTGAKGRSCKIIMETHDGKDTNITGIKAYYKPLPALA